MFILIKKKVFSQIFKFIGWHREAPYFSQDFIYSLGPQRSAKIAQGTNLAQHLFLYGLWAKNGSNNLKLLKKI